jgi:hypothetical protein
MVEGDGFEPPNPRERIYSPSRLATSLPLHIIEETFLNRKKVAQDGIEPPTQGFSVLCSTD